MRDRRGANQGIRVHFLDVGRKEYGDAVLCRLGETTVLIDGAHPGDQVGTPGHPSIPEQLGTLLGQAAPPYAVDLLVATHAHQDHIGCLPFLVEHGLLRAEWALVADPGLGWGRTANDAAPPIDSRTLHLVSALREEILSDRTDDATLAQFMADAAGLEQRYSAMIERLAHDGTHVVRQGRDPTDELVDAFEAVGLRILGPSDAQLLLCAEAIRKATTDAIRTAEDMFRRDDAPAGAVAAYRRLVSPGLDSIDASDRPGPPINLQSVVTSFEVGGVKLLFAGDMQFADPQTGDARIRDEVRALRAAIEAEAPFDLAKLSHHGSDNALSAEFLAQLGATPLFGICAGEESTHHPNPEVLRLLDLSRDHLSWVRTDRNGLSTVAFGTHEPSVTVDHGDVSDPTPNAPDELATPPRPPAETIAEERREVVHAGEVEVVARIPHTDTRVAITVEVSPGASGATDVPRSTPPPPPDVRVGAGRDLSNLLFVTSREGLVKNVGRSEAGRLLTAMERQGLDVYDALPPRCVESAGSISLVREQLRRRPDLRGVVIVGGYDVVPAQRYDCLPTTIRDAMGASDDPDDFIVWSDDAYGDRAGDRAPELPVTRVPDGRSEGFLLAALAAPDGPRPAARRGVRNVARPFAEPVFGRLPGDEVLLSSAPTTFDQAPSVSLDAERVYLMLHGDFLDSTRFWGEETANGREAVNLTNVPSPCGRTVFTGCCWGALIADQPASRALPGQVAAPKLPGASMALTFLARGATAFVGCTGAHYSPSIEPYDYFGGPMHESFWRNALAGSPPAQALFEAKAEYARGLPHGRTTPAQQAIELKILHQYTCLGLGW